LCVPFSPPLPRNSFIPLFLFALSGSPLVVRLHRLGRVVVYVATFDATTRGYLPGTAVGLAYRLEADARFVCYPKIQLRSPLATEQRHITQCMEKRMKSGKNLSALTSCVKAANGSNRSMIDLSFLQEVTDRLSQPISSHMVLIE
jgi:hypothetical protein